MSKFILLTSFDGTRSLVNISKVRNFETVQRNGNEYTRIVFENNRDDILVKENCELIYTIILSNS